jgi:hypothetical protein
MAWLPGVLRRLGRFQRLIDWKQSGWRWISTRPGDRLAADGLEKAIQMADRFSAQNQGGLW